MSINAKRRYGHVCKTIVPLYRVFLLIFRDTQFPSCHIHLITSSELANSFPLFDRIGGELIKITALFLRESLKEIILSSTFVRFECI